MLNAEMSLELWQLNNLWMSFDVNNIIDNNNNKNYYSPVSNSRCHSMRHKVQGMQKEIRVDIQGMGINLGRESNFKEVCFKLGTENWQRGWISGIRKDWVPESGTNDTECLFAKRCLDIWNGKNQWIRWSCRHRMWWKRESIVETSRLLFCKICMWWEVSVAFWCVEI